MGDQTYRMGQDPQRVVDEMMGVTEPGADLRRQRNELPGEKEITRAVEQGSGLLDSAKGLWRRLFNDSADQPASDFRADQKIAREFVQAVENGDVPIEMFKAAQDVRVFNPEALTNSGGGPDLKNSFENSFISVLNDPEKFGLTGDKSPENGRLYARVENNQFYYDLREVEDAVLTSNQPAGPAGKI